MKTIIWAIVNRGGIALLTGILLVPSQLICPNAKTSNEMIDRASKSNPASIEKFDLPINDSSSIKGVISYPKNWNRHDRSRCVVYHNPNAMTVPNFFETGNLDWTPAEIVKLARCPIIMYDYRGTGLSSGNQTSRLFQFRPTCESIVYDGEKVLCYALEKFKEITIMGSSLGGAVATASLAELLNAKVCPTSPCRPAPGRILLINHDSFTISTSVVMPKWPTIASWIGWMIGGCLDAATPMKTIVDRNIPVTVLYHQNDPVIPRGARMADFVRTLPKQPNVSVFDSPEYGHANLSQDMVRSLSARQFVYTPRRF